MDVMKPDLLWVERRCYRWNPVVKSEETDSYVEEDYQQDFVECDDDEPCDEFDIEHEDGKYKTSFHVARAYFPYIIGMKGNTRRRLENETKTHVKVPKPGQEGDIVVIGFDKRGVCAARRRINLIVMSSRLKQPFTHFLSIPMTSRSILEGFEKFKTDILENFKSRGVDASIFQVPEKLHLTLATMVLGDNEERETAALVLQKCNEAVIEPLMSENKSLKVRMAGIEFMNDDPKEVDVLYGKVQMADGSNLLQDLAEGVVEFFVRFGGFMEKQYDRVKLHVTLMNTIFREDRGGVSEQETTRGKRKPREAFDASDILSHFSDYDFGIEIVNSIHLSQRYTTSQNGYYQSTVTLEIA